MNQMGFLVLVFHICWQGEGGMSMNLSIFPYLFIRVKTPNAFPLHLGHRCSRLLLGQLEPWHIRTQAL